MIIKFSQFIKEAASIKTGIISINLDGRTCVFHLKIEENQDGMRIYLCMDNQDYQDLSIIIPDSKKLNKDEFFLNPIVDKKIVTALEKENFIEKGTMTSIAGDKPTQSYYLNFKIEEKVEDKYFKQKEINYKIVVNDDNEKPKFYITNFKILKDDGSYVVIKGIGYEYKKVDKEGNMSWVSFEGKLKVSKKDFKDGSVRIKHIVYKYI